MAFPFNRREPGVWLSGIAHMALLAAGIVAFAAEKLPDPEEGIPVEILTDNQVNEITRGETNAETPQDKPRVDRQAEISEQRDPQTSDSDAPTPPTRPVEVKTAERDVEPTPAEEPSVEPAPVPPSRPDFAKAEAEAEAKAEAAAKAAAAAAAAKAAAARETAAKEAAAKAEAKAKADAAAKAEAVKLAQLAEAEEKAAEERARKDSEAKARVAAKAKAEAAAKKIKEEAEAKAALDRKVAQAQAEADAKARAEARAAAAKAKAEAAAKAAEQRRKVAEARAAAKAKADAEARARRQAEAADRFNPGDISRMLQSRAPSQSSGSTGREVQRTASLGAAAGNSPKLNPSQRAQIVGLIRDQLRNCWSPSPAAQTAANPPVPKVRITLNQDGSLLSEPMLMNASSDPLFRPLADSALRATRRCSPLQIPAQFAAFYQDWKLLAVDFDPRD